MYIDNYYSGLFTFYSDERLCEILMEVKLKLYNCNIAWYHSALPTTLLHSLVLHCCLCTLPWWQWWKMPCCMSQFGRFWQVGIMKINETCVKLQFITEILWNKTITFKNYFIYKYIFFYCTIVEDAQGYGYFYLRTTSNFLLGVCLSDDLQV